MPPPTAIPDFDPRFFRPCSFAHLRDLGYGTRVTLNNGIPAEHQFASEMDVSMSVFDVAGSRLTTIADIKHLQPGEMVKLSIDDILTADPAVPATGNLLCILHVVPSRWAGEPLVELSTREMMAHVGASDDFIEYHQKPKGVITGVAYQTGPMNDARFSSTRTTMVQAPKVIVSDSVDTMFALLNISTGLDYDAPVTIDYWILSAAGEKIARSSQTVPAFSFRLVSMRGALERADKLEEFAEAGGIGMFLGYAANGSLVPLSLTFHRHSGAIACDHTLPPTYYVSTWGGEARLNGNKRLAAEFFQTPAQVAT